MAWKNMWTEHGTRAFVEAGWGLIDRNDTLRHPDPTSWQARERAEVADEVVAWARDILNAIDGGYVVLSAEEDALTAEKDAHILGFDEGYEQALADIEELAAASNAA